MYDESKIVSHLEKHVRGIRKYKGEWLVVDKSYIVFHDNVEYVGRTQIPKVFVEPYGGHGYKHGYECRTYKRIDELFNTEEEALLECEKRNLQLKERTCINCGDMKYEPVYFFEDVGYCANCLITKLAEVGHIFKDEYTVII